MAGRVLTVDATVTCTHQGRAQPQPAQQRVRIAGQYADVVPDLYTVGGCPFTAGNKPQPCVTVSWSQPATRVRVAGSPVLLQSSTGLCRSAEQITQGTAAISVVQQRVTAR